MTNKNIIVTGGAGYIGSHVCKALSRAGYNPVTYDNLVTGNKHAVKWGEFEQGDILDRKHFAEVIRKYNAAAIIHMAAYIAVGESVSNPGKYYHNNTLGGLNVIQAMCDASLDKIVFSSTAAVYGIPDKLPVIEKSAVNPINPYGFSKYAVEHILADYKTSSAIKSVIFRYFNVAGADVELEVGCEQRNPNNLIPILMNVQSGKQEYLEIFGTDYATPDGTAIRDYIHVSDIAHAHVLALEYLLGSGDNTTLNLGTGRGYSVLEVIESVQRCSGMKVLSRNAPRRVGDPPILYADARKASKILGWKPEYTDLDIITKTAWDWQCNVVRNKEYILYPA